MTKLAIDHYVTKFTNDAFLFVSEGKTDLKTLHWRENQLTGPLAGRVKSVNS